MNKINIHTIFKVLISALYVGVEASMTMIFFTDGFCTSVPGRILLWCFGTICMITLWALSMDFIDGFWE